MRSELLAATLYHHDVAATTAVSGSSYRLKIVGRNNLIFFLNRNSFLGSISRPKCNMASKRVEQIAAHLNFPKGMLAGQVAIITGSGQGIGAEVARLFSNEGAKVVVSDIDAGEFPSHQVYRHSR